MDLTLLFQLKIIFLILKVQNTFELKVSCLKYILLHKVSDGIPLLGLSSFCIIRKLGWYYAKRDRIIFYDSSFFVRLLMVEGLNNSLILSNAVKQMFCSF
jgi:hypothetical protein